MRELLHLALRRAALCCALLTLVGLSATRSAAGSEAAVAEPGVRRYALVVGSHHGREGEARLRFAGADAQRVADLLRGPGRTPAPELLVDVDAAHMRRALEAMRRRVEHDRALYPQATFVFVFFYSGHAGTGGLHPQGSLLSYQELVAMTDAVAADARVLIVDACHAGVLTRSKGAVFADPFPIVVPEAQVGQGTAVLAAATAEGLAHESETLQGSFFTHHLVSGLRGAADRDGDGRVTLSEAYAYAYVETLRTSGHALAPQRPTFALDWHGSEDLVLTHLDGAHERTGAVELEAAGLYLIFAGGPTGALVAEVQIPQGGRRMLLEAGSYHVRHHGEGRAREGRVVVREAASVRANPERWRRVPVGLANSKGPLAEAATLRWAIEAAAGFTNPLWQGASLGPSATLGVRVDRGAWALASRLSWTQGHDQGLAYEARDARWRTDGLLTWGWRHAFWRLDAGASAGVEHWRQAVQTSVHEEMRVAWVPRIGPLLRLHLGWRAPWSLWLEAEHGASWPETLPGPRRQVRHEQVLRVGAHVYLF